MASVSADEDGGISEEVEDTMPREKEAILAMLQATTKRAKNAEYDELKVSL